MTQGAQTIILLGKKYAVGKGAVMVHVSTPSEQHQWASIANYLRLSHRVFVHFAVSGNGYWSAFRYGWWPTKHKVLSELDGDFLLVNGRAAHPPPDVAAKRPLWSGRKRRKQSSSAPGPSPPSAETKEEKSDSEDKEDEKNPCGNHPVRREPVWAYAFRLIRDHGLRTEDAFLGLVKRLDNPRLNSLCMQRSAKTLVEKALHLLEADVRLERSKKSRIKILQEAAASVCSCVHPGSWKSAALELLRFHKICTVDFARAVVAALESGASKGINVFIHGSTTSGKSWILDPLRLIYHCHFIPPSGSTFPLQDLPQKEVILWQDFRVDDKVIPWNHLLTLFEGTAVTIRRPRNDFQGDLDYKVCQPVFLTSGSRLSHYDPNEVAMMDRRFRFFSFEQSLPLKMVRKLEPCAACFASLFLSFSAPPQDVPQLGHGDGPNVEASQASSSQETASSGAELPRSASTSSASSSSSCSSSGKGLFCVNCGLLLTSSRFCGTTGHPHL